MASSLTDVDLLSVKELGKYSVESDFLNENGRPHEKSRVLTADKVDYVRSCDECGKHMDKAKRRYECSCKLAIHCSKVCFKSSSHKCEEFDIAEYLEDRKDKLWSDPKNKGWNSYYRDILDKNVEVGSACVARSLADIYADRGPSSDKIKHLKKITRGDHRRILKYGEARNPTAAWIIGSAYVSKEMNQPAYFTFPGKSKELSKEETINIAIRWLKVAAEGGVPEAMFLLYYVLILGWNWRDSQFWLTEAHATGKMDYLSPLLETPQGVNCPHELDFMYHQFTKASMKQICGDKLANLLVATRFQELKVWGGKTAMGKPFYGWGQFQKLMESIGEIKNDRAKPSYIVGEKKTLVIILACPGFLDLVDQSRKESDVKFTESRGEKRDENNVRFMQGAKDEASLDYQLVGQTSNKVSRTKYLIACKHSPIDDMMEAIGRESVGRENSLDDLMKRFKYAGKCKSCVEEAKQRLRAVSLGLFSISITHIFSSGNYTARYAKGNGVIIEDIFCGYSKPYIRQTLQCLMSNPGDLHPLAVAENTMLFWPIIWFWGSVYAAVQDCCDKATLDAIYGSLGDKIEVVKAENASAMAAFPEAAAGEWRIACGNEDCPRVDHEVKFNLCEGCKVRRYCDPACQRQDWPKHKLSCKAGKKGEN